MPEDVVSGYTTVEEDGVTKYKAGQRRFVTVGRFARAPVLSEITRLRDEAAKLLGYKNHAEWVLEVRRGSVEHTGPFCRPLVRWNAR